MMQGEQMGKSNNNRIRRRARLPIFIAGALWALAAHAHHACDYGPGNPYGAAPVEVNVPLNGLALAVARDQEDGAILYQQRIDDQNAAFDVACANDATASGAERQWLSVTPLPKAAWNAGPYTGPDGGPYASPYASPYAGHVYQTGVPGIGVAFTSVPGEPWDRIRPFVSVGARWHPRLQAGIVLIKTGPVSPGGIAGADLPTAELDIVSNGHTVTLARIRFVGRLAVVASTCATPDVAVPLGQHAAEAFAGKGTGTLWRSFSIDLRHCPADLARPGNTGPDETGPDKTAPDDTDHADDADDAAADGLPAGAGRLRVSLAPTTSRPPGAPGVVLPARTASGPAAARGVGIAITDAAGAAVPFQRFLPDRMIAREQGGATRRIPLRTRFVQFSDTAPLPGPASASLTFNIDYP